MIFKLFSIIYNTLTYFIFLTVPFARYVAQYYNDLTF